MRESKTSDRLGRYYTDSIVGRTLIEAMEMEAPSTVVDLGSGAGSLVLQASQHWTKSSFITVDIDSNVNSARFPATLGSTFKHHTLDALDPTLAEKLGLCWGHADAALCNPPYIRTRWRKSFSQILEDAGLSHLIPRVGKVPTDLLFVAQNLRMLRSGGRLGLILPDGLISGEKYQSFRKVLLQSHCIKNVIELPRRIFKNTDAKAHIVVVEKNGAPGSNILVERLSEEGAVSGSITVPAELAIKRLDYSFLSVSVAAPLLEPSYKLAVLRGAASSTTVKCSPRPIFHTTNFTPEMTHVPPHFQLADRHRYADTCAQAGDILVARVGRNLSSKICMVRAGEVAISDCILAIRVERKYQKRLFAGLRSPLGEALLDGASHGVGARFITASALKEIAKHILS